VIARRVLVVGMLLLAACTPRPEEPEESAVMNAPTAPSTVTGPRIRVLGTAQDGGFPHAACDCERCALARRDPAVRQRIASLAIIVPPRVYLIDATPDVREQLTRLTDVRDSVTAQGVDRAPVDGVFLTHAHIGHYLGLAFFGFEAVHTKDLPVYGTASMAEFLATNGPWNQLLRLGNIRTVVAPPGEVVALEDGVTVEPIAVPHRQEYTDTVGYKIRGPRSTVLYIPDCDPWHAWSEERPSLKELLTGVDVALLDGSFYSGDELPGRDLKKIGHPLITDTMDRLEGIFPGTPSNGVRIFFTHFNHSNPVLNPASSARWEIEARGFGVAVDGLELPL
jgi:pyrroloquinoline quinone biosynthesis protein B